MATGREIGNCCVVKANPNIRSSLNSKYRKLVFIALLYDTRKLMVIKIARTPGGRELSQLVRLNLLLLPAETHAETNKFRSKSVSMTRIKRRSKYTHLLPKNEKKRIHEPQLIGNGYKKFSKSSMEGRVEV